LFPKVLGIALIVGGSCYLVDTLLLFVIPDLGLRINTFVVISFRRCDEFGFDRRSKLKRPEHVGPGSSRSRPNRGGDEMPEPRIGTREEWEAARARLATLEAKQAERNEEIIRTRRELPWVLVEKEYEFDTEEGKKTLIELFDGRSQLLAYNIMYGPDFKLGACPGCTSLADGFDGTLVHMNHQDVTFVCFSRAPISRLAAYKARMGWQFPYVSTYRSDFPFDFGLALTEEQASGSPHLKELVDNPPDELRFWSQQVGAELKDGLRENPSYIAFAREGDTVYHTYTVSAPDPFVAPFFSFLLERTPKPQGDVSSIYRKDEYPG
jgi:predicted dithiol-disulfide oxidoreductase (DUF899 family)